MVRGALGWVWLLAVLAALLPTGALGADAELYVVARELEEGQVGAIQILVRGDRPTAPPRLAVTPADGLEIRYQSQGQEVTIVNSKVTKFYEYTYRVTALKAGTYTLGPAEIEVGTRQLRTATGTMKVTPRNQSTKRDFEVHANFDVDEAWVGQVVVYRRGFRSRRRVLRDTWPKLPLEGLLPTRDGEPTQTEYSLRGPDGDVQVREEFHPKVLTTPGDREVPAAVARLDVAVGVRGRGPFAMQRTKTEVIATEPSRLLVKPLPPGPSNFSGLVGDFEFTSELDRRKVAVGESVNWSVSVVGSGTLEGFALPKPDDVPGARLYDSSPATAARVDADGYHAEGRFARVIVPTAAGELTVPPVEIVVFSPSRGEYVTHTLTIPSLTVRKGKLTGDSTFESFLDTDAGIDPDLVVEAEAYEGVRDVATSSSRASVWIGGWMPWTLGLAALPLVVLGFTEGAAALRRVVTSMRRERPVREITPLQRLNRLPEDPSERLAELDAALRHSLARVQGVPVAHVDRAAAAGLLPDDVGEAVHDLTRRLDRARFADEGGDDLERAVRELVTRIEAHVRRSS